jgi:hypothetical protein
VEVGFEALHEIAPQLAALLAELPQRRAGFVTHGAVGIERAAQEIGERLEARQAREGPREIGRLGDDGAAVGGEARGGVEQGRRAAISAPSATEPGTRERSRSSRTSGTDSQGGLPATAMA